MLGKLIKYDWKRMWKIPVLLIILLNCAAITAGQTFRWHFFDNEFTILTATSGLIMFLFVCGIMGSSLGIFIYLAVSFYKSTYSDEGYLLHTLPVTPREILFSKIIVMSILQFMIGLGICLSLIILFITTSNNLGLTFEEIQDAFMLMRRDLEPLFRSGIPSFTSFIVLFILLIIISIIYSGTYIVSSVTLGQLARKHKIGASILAAILINIAVSSIVSFVQLPVIGLGWNIDESNIIQYFFLYLALITLCQAIITIILYIISEYVMTKKLNLE